MCSNDSVHDSTDEKLVGKPCRRMKIACLLEPTWLFINPVQESVESFELYSRHHFSFFSTLPIWKNSVMEKLDPISYDDYDAILIHYCARPCTGMMVPEVAEAVRKFRGFKAMMLQDEYEFTEISRRWIREHGINHVFTVVPEQYITKVYPPESVPGVTFTSILTGYVPLSLERSHHVRPLEERKIAIGYRGRSLPYQYGDLAREKLEIGQYVRAVCERRGIPVDIEWTEEKRIYGRDWNDFLQNSRATLGTESGANIFDMEGSIAKNIKNALAMNPKLSYEEAKERFLVEENIGVRMNQISAKLFEFITARTALILFEGEYSGVLQPRRHYLPLRKDYSNLDEILDQLEDLPLLKEMTGRAYDDVVASGAYSYRQFIRQVDPIFEKHVSPRNTTPVFGTLPSVLPLPKPLNVLRETSNSSAARIKENSVAVLSAKELDFAAMIDRRTVQIEKLKANLAQFNRERQGPP